jgi:hypothetical protein
MLQVQRVTVSGASETSNLVAPQWQLPLRIIASLPVCCGNIPGDDDKNWQRRSLDMSTLPVMSENEIA